MKKVISRIITVVLLMQIISFNGAYAARKDTIVSIDDLYDWRRDTVVSVEELYKSKDVDDMYTEFGDTQAVKLYADRYDFSRNWATNSEISYNSRKVFSGWESDEIGGRITVSSNSLNLSDTSTAFPVSIVKRIERATYGVLTLSFRTTVTSYSDGFSWTLADDRTDGVAICTSDNAFYIRQPGDELVKLGDLSINTEYGFIVKADIDNGTVKVYLNGVLVADNLELLNEVSGIDRFAMASSKAAHGTFEVPSVSLERGYAVREHFETQTNTALSALWSSGGAGTVTCKAYANNPNNDNYDMLFSTASGSAAAQRGFSEQTGKTVFEFKQYISAARDGIEVKLQKYENTVLSLKTKNGKFYSQGKNAEQEFYTYTPNLWYTFKVVLDLQNKTADIYLNGKKKQSDVALNYDSVNIVRFEAQQSSKSVEFDDILIYSYEDYTAPSVSIPAKKDNNILIGMQVCPIWREGTSLGWEYVRNYSERIPYLGFYDEGNPEVSDWEIKWMAEHGIDFTWNCWYRKADNLGPIRVTNSSSSILDGYFYAKNSDKLKFAIMFENSQYEGKTQEELTADFKENIVPYWIEYFLKDDRYFKINGRPVVGIYNYDRLTEAFNGRSGISSCFDYLTTECSKNEISEPIFILQTFDEGTANFSKYSGAGFDFVYSYHRSDSTPKKLMTYLNGIKINGQLNVITSLPVGYNDRAWQGTPADSTYGIATAEEYAGLCDWAKETYIPSLSSNSFGKNLVMIDTWNEYGEGHYTIPSNLEGFGYLDAVRSAFTNGGAHTDAVPTDEQKDRFNNLYPFVTEKSIKSKTVPPVSTQILKQWSFNTDGNAEGWSAIQDISSLDVLSGYMRAILSDDEPCIGIENISIPIRDVKYLKIRIGNYTTGSKGKLLFRTSDAGYSDFTTIDFNIHSRGDDPQDGKYYEDIYIPVYENSLWKGTLTGLKLMPCLSGNYTTGVEYNRFYIDEISLIDGNGQDMVEGAMLLVNGTPVECSEDLIVDDGVPYITASKFRDLLNMLYSYDEDTETAIFSNGAHTLTMKIDGARMYYDNNAASFVGGAIMKDDTVYVHYKAFTLFDYLVTYDVARQLIILRNPWYGNGYDDIIPNSFTENDLNNGKMPEIYDNAVIGGTFENGGDAGRVTSRYNSATVRLTGEEEPIYNEKSLYVKTVTQNSGVALPAYLIAGEKYYVRATVRMLEKGSNQVSFALRMHTLTGDTAWKGDINVQKIEQIGRAVTLQGYYTAPGVINDTIYVSVAPWENATYVLDNVEVIHVRKDTPADTVIGEFSFYKNFGGASAQKGTQLSSGVWSAVLRNFENLADTDKDVTVMIALYKDNELREIVPVKQNISEYSYIKQPIAATLDVPVLSDGEYHAKGFLFDDLKNMTPLTEYILINE